MLSSAPKRNAIIEAQWKEQNPAGAAWTGQRKQESNIFNYCGSLRVLSENADIHIHLLLN